MPGVVDEEQDQQYGGDDAQEYDVHRHHEVALNCRISSRTGVRGAAGAGQGT